MSESAVQTAAPCRDVRFTVLVETKGSNAREHFHAHAHRVEQERKAVALAWMHLRIGQSAGLFLPAKILRVPRGVTKKQRALAKRTGADLRVEHFVSKPIVPLVVELTRVSFGKLDDDNLRQALKGVRDQLAWEMGISDRDPLVKWDYESPGQRHGPKGSAAVHVRIRAADLEATA
jgi:hypothetical protein